MNEYTVRWSIQLSANSPAEAAELANDWIADPERMCHIYLVTDGNGSEYTIDLDFPDDNE